MQTVIDQVVALILALFQIVVTVIASIEGILRSALVPMGIGVQGQDIVLLVAAVVLIIGAIRFLGGVFAILITILLVLLALNVVLPGLGMGSSR
jgi:hypothetical protein